jgi:hypothetical protein
MFVQNARCQLEIAMTCIPNDQQTKLNLHFVMKNQGQASNG